MNSNILEKGVRTLSKRKSHGRRCNRGIIRPDGLSKLDSDYLLLFFVAFRSASIFALVASRSAFARSLQGPI